MSVLRARRVEVDPLDASSRESLQRAAARSGALHVTRELAVCAFGAAAVLELPDGLGHPSTARTVAEGLEAIDLDGEGGPGGTGVLAMAALPFDPAAPAHLVVPSLVAAWRPGDSRSWVTSVVRASESPDPFDALSAVVAGDEGHDSRGQRNEVATSSERPSGAAYAESVRQCVAVLATGRVDKVVLARSRVGRCRSAIDPAVLAAALYAYDPACDLYAYPVAQGRFVGASPELVVATSGGAVTAHPLAGTVSLTGGRGDDERIAWLLGSEKNRIEHSLVVDDVLARLAPLCDSLSAPGTPSVVRLSTDARLGTWVEGKLLGGGGPATAMEALVALHPTPAVAGSPRDDALALIAAHEVAPRGPWAGAVGWVDRDGTSTWTLALRGLRVSGREFEVWGGAGIVAQSVPDEERLETEAKLASVLRVLSS